MCWDLSFLCAKFYTFIFNFIVMSYRSFPRCRCDFPRLRLSIGFLDYIKPSTLDIYTNDRRDIFLNMYFWPVYSHILTLVKNCQWWTTEEIREIRWTGEMGGLVCRGGDWGSPRAAQRVLAVPMGSAVVFTPSASVFPPPKYGWVTGIHWMDCMSIVVDFSDNFVVVMHLPFSRSLVHILCIFTFSCF